MKRYILLFILGLFLGGVQAQNLQASLSFARYYNPELGSYVETYLSVDAAGVQLQEVENGKYQAKVNLLLMFKIGDSIVDFSKTQLNSPVLDDTLNVNFNFLDQQRFFLPNGKYTLEIEFQDATKEGKVTQASADIDLYFSENTIQISDVEFLSSYEKSTEWKVNTKNGFDMVPHVSTFFPESEKKLTYYAEIYNTKKVLGESEKFLVSAFVSNTNDRKVVNDLIIRRRMDVQEVNVLLSQFDLSELASGNYFLNLEIRNKSNEVMVANKSFFQVSNPEVLFNEDLLAKIESGESFVSKFSSDSINYLIKSIYPIATPAERLFIDNSDEENVSEITKRKFLAFFWESRDKQNPEFAWKKYQVEVIKTNNSFGNKYMPGFETDRGRVYLQYGPPNTISDQEFEAGGGMHDGSVPYQIWHYYEIGDQRDGKFVFYNPHLIPNGYTLLHSNVVGEINNPHWQTYLHRNQLESIDAPDNDRYGGRSGELYNDPR
jgi:GWxTD domain-containing protein